MLTIYDVGMHIGQDTEFYLKKGFRVIAIEANPYLCKDAREKFASFIQEGQLVILETGVANSSQELTFYINPHISEWSSFDREIGMRGCDTCETLTIKCRKLSDIIKEYGDPYYVKIDIEGYDKAALESLKEDKVYPDYISVENGALMLNILVEMGYTGFKYIQQSNIASLVPPFPAKEGEYIPFKFQAGASGLFGEETEGEWKSAQEIEKVMAKVWDPITGEKNPKHDDNIDGWFDLHARHKRRESKEVARGE